MNHGSRPDRFTNLPLLLITCTHCFPLIERYLIEYFVFNRSSVLYTSCALNRIDNKLSLPPHLSSKFHRVQEGYRFPCSRGEAGGLASLGQ